MTYRYFTPESGIVGAERFETLKTTSRAEYVYARLEARRAGAVLALSWAVWRLSLKYKLYPGIRERDVHKTPKPRIGGVGMFLGFAAMVALLPTMGPMPKIQRGAPST